MARHIKVKGDLEVKKGDVIVRARYKLNPLSLKFVTALIAGLKRSDDINEEYVFKVKDFQELTELKRKDLYWAVKEAVRELLDKPLHIPTEEGFIMCNWISGGHYVENAGEVRFMIYPKLRPYLLEAQEKFLKYKLENILTLRSSYSIRMYEILKDWHNQHKRYNNIKNTKKLEKIVEVEWLRKILEVPKSYPYGGSSGLKNRVIEKAKKELEEKTDIKFDYVEIKTGRKVTHVKFIIEENPKNAKELEDEYYFLQSKQHFIAYIRKHYKNKTFRVIDYRQHGGGKVEYHIGEDGLVWMRDEHNLEKLPAEHIDEFFENSLKHAKENTQYAELLYKKQEIS